MPKDLFMLNLSDILDNPLNFDDLETKEKENYLDEILVVNLKKNLTESQICIMKVELRKLYRSFRYCGCEVDLHDLANDFMERWDPKKTNNYKLKPDDTNNRPIFLYFKTFVDDILKFHYCGKMVQMNEKSARAALKFACLIDKLNAETEFQQFQKHVQSATCLVHDLSSHKLICKQLAHVLLADLKSIEFDYLRILTPGINAQE